MPAKPTKSNAESRTIRADADGERQFVLHPENDDLFVQTGKQIIEACRLNIGIKVWLDELREVFSRVRDWSSQRSDRIRACLATPRGGKIVLFYVPARNRFDFDLAEELTDLNRELIQQFNIGMVEIYQIPWEETDRFIPPDAGRLVFGEQPATHPAVEA